MTDALIKEMRVGIAAARSGKNLPTRFKKKNEVINKQLGKQLDFLENRHLNRISEKEFIEKKQEWEVVVKKYMPKFYRMEAQAIFFNFFETEIIRREITDDLEEFWYSKIKNVVFATSAKVYAYPNQVVSVRIMLAKIYRIPLEDITNKEEEKEYYCVGEVPKNGIATYDQGYFLPRETFHFIVSQQSEEVDKLKKELLTLSVEDYMQTVKDIRFPRKSEMREFGKVYNGSEDVYIKIRVELLGMYGEVTTFVMSFHFAEKAFTAEMFPYRKN